MKGKQRHCHAKSLLFWLCDQLESCVTRQPDHNQAYKTNAAAERLVRLTDQLEGITPGDGLIELSPLDALSDLTDLITEHREHTEHVEDIYQA